MKILDKIYITRHCAALKLKAAQKYNIAPEKCHIGHLLIQGMLERPNALNQIDAATDERETNLSVAIRCMRLASAMHNYGLQPGNSVIVMGHNHLDLCIPFYACHFNGYSMCAVDPSITPVDLKALLPSVDPKMVFCQKSCVEKVKEAFMANNLKGEIITFDDKTNDLEGFIHQHKGTEIKFRPNEFDQDKIMAWLMLTSGTTGLPKVAKIPFATLTDSVCCWWYPAVTAWTPYLLGQFLVAAENGCDLSSFKYIAIGGSSIEKALLDKFRTKCDAYLYLVYGMTELVVPVFEFDLETPVNSTGYPMDKYQYKLIDDDGNVINKPYKSGELWIRGENFFKGYLNNPEETEAILTDDGWIKTGDIFYRDEQDFYFFVERRRLLIKHYGFLIPPLQMEEVIKRHPGVVEACVVGVPDPECMERPIAAILRRNGDKVDPKEIFALLKTSLSEYKQLSGGLFFVDSFPVTPSGKINRSKVRELAQATPTITSN